MPDPCAGRLLVIQFRHKLDHQQLEARQHTLGAGGWGVHRMAGWDGCGERWKQIPAQGLERSAVVHEWNRLLRFQRQ